MTADALSKAAQLLAEAAADLRGPPTRGGRAVSILQAAPYVTIEKAAELTGYSRRAIEEKIAKGVWLEGDVWRKAPDGRRLVSLASYARWVEGGRR